MARTYVKSVVRLQGSHVNSSRELNKIPIFVYGSPTGRETICVYDGTFEPESGGKLEEEAALALIASWAAVSPSVGLGGLEE